MTKLPSGTLGREHSAGIGVEEGQHGELLTVAGTEGEEGGEEGGEEQAGATALWILILASGEGPSTLGPGLEQVASASLLGLCLPH